MSLAFGFLGSGCGFMSQTHNIIQSSIHRHYNAPNYNCLDITLCSVVLSGPTWETSLVVGKAMDLYHSQQVRFCVVDFQETLSPLVPFPHAKKSVEGNWTYTYVKLCSSRVLFACFVGLS